MMDSIPPDLHFAPIDPLALGGTTADFRNPGERDLLARWDSHQAWFDTRLRHGMDPYNKATHDGIGPACIASERPGGASLNGVNFASQDYLNLASHAHVHHAARGAIERYGVHSAGSVALMGNTALSLRLEARLADFLGYADSTLFPTGWAAGYGAIRTLAGPGDHILIDVLAHACLQEGARNSGARVSSFPHLSQEAVERRLERIRREDPGAGILVVTETLFSMDSDVPEIAPLQALCRRFGATLLVDVAHDLGALGATGRGVLESQSLCGEVDVVMGSFSKTFASNGGFVASNAPGLKLALRVAANPLTFSNALSPVQAAIVLAALEIVEAPEGADRRARLMGNVLHMRHGLAARGFSVLGQPSAIVPVVLGDNAVSRLMTHYAGRLGGIVNLVEFPAVARNGCRWRIQLMADHTIEHIDRFLHLADRARALALAHLAALGADAPAASVEA